MPGNFEEFLKNKYWEKEDFRQSVEKSAKGKGVSKPSEKIPLYLERVKKILKEKRGLFEKISLYQRFIIKPHNIPDDYFKNVLLGNFAEQKGYTREQLKNPEIAKSVINQFEKETGQDFNNYQIPAEEKKKLINQIIEDQKKSLDLWLDYLTSPEAENYPDVFRYWAFAEMLKLGTYDQERKEFTKRTEKTVAPFPELNPQALSIVLDEIKRKYSKDPSSLILPEGKKEEFQRILESENFNKLYSFALEYVKSLLLPEERLPIIKGKWKVFKKGSDPKELVKTLQGYNTGWCIAGEATAQSYLSRSDILIFFSEDKDGKPVIPRAAIVTDGSRISEVRGIAKNQNLDQYITPVIEEKLKEIPGGEKWQKRTEQMKKLAEIYLKHLQEEELTKEDLRFIYEIDEKIEGFGYEEDPRIKKIITKRDIKEDLAKVFDCYKDQISLTEEEALKGDIKFHYGNLYLRRFTLAQELKFKGLKLPRKIRGELDLGGLTSAEDLNLPEEIGRGLYLSGLTSAEGLKLPKKIRGFLDLHNLTSAEGLKLPEEIGGGLYLRGLTSAEGLKLPEEIGGELDLRGLTSAEGLKLPKKIGGSLYLSGLTSAKGLQLPEKIGRDLDLRGLTSAEGLKLPKKIGGDLDLQSLTSAEGLKLPEEIGGYLDLRGLTSAKGLKLPEKIGGGLNLRGLTSAEGLKLPEEIGGELDLRGLTSAERNELRKKYPHLADKIYPNP
jgi:hypothetical protein